MWENCYYEPGDDDGVLDTPDGPVGAAMCWELVRMQTPRRLRGKVDLLVGGSCWWDLPQRVPIPGSKRISKRNHEIMADTPGRFARLVGAPFVHAAHVGDFSCGTPLAPGLSYDSFYLGEAQIVDAHGEILARRTRQEGEGILYADVIPGRIAPGEALADRYWIPEFPAVIRMAWSFQNAHGRRYYNRHFASGARQL
jgi:predicted amidohydrolase